MINKKVSINVLAATLLITSNVFADQRSSTYGGIQFASFDYSINDASGDFSPTGLIGRLGKDINENFSLEGRFGIGLSDDAITASDGFINASVSIEIDTLLGAYGLAHARINESSSIYALIGFTKIDTTFAASISGFGSTSLSEDDSGLSFGVGAEIGLSRNVALNIEYVQYLNESEYDINVLSAGAKFGF